MKKNIAGIAAGALCVLLGTGAWAGGTEPVIKIGHAAPPSGAIAHIGRDNENGARFAVEQINRRGGITVGGRRHRLELVTADDRADPKEAMRVAQQLVDSGVVAVVGHLNSGTSIPAAPVYARAGVALVSPSATHPRLTALGLNTVFRLIANDTVQAIAMAQYATNDLHARRVLVLSDNTPYGNQLARVFSEQARQSGLTIVHNAVWQNRAGAAAALGSAKERGADLVVFGGMDDQAADIALQLAAAGLDVPLLAGDGSCTPEFIRRAQAQAKRLHCTQSGEAVDLMVGGKAFMASFRKRFGTSVYIYAPYAHDAVHVIADAIRRAGSTERSALAAALRDTDYPGLIGPIRFDTQGDLRHLRVSVFQVRERLLDYVKTVHVGPLPPPLAAQSIAQVREQLLHDVRTGRSNPFPAGTHAHEASTRLLVRVIEENGLIEAIMEQAKQWPAGTDQIARALTLIDEWMDQGLPLLPDALAERYLQVEAEMLRRATPQQCGRLANRSLAREEKLLLIAALPAEHVDIYVAAAEHAVLAALRKDQPLMLSVEQRQATRSFIAQAIRENITPEQRARVAQVARERPGQFNDEELCFLTRITLEATLRAPADMRALMFRSMMTSKAE